MLRHAQHASEAALIWRDASRDMPLDARRR
jgi:hypothetical protein